MTNRLFRAFGASLIVLSALATAIPANAATMPWTWTDISDQLTIRQNRPIWAMAYASPFWYYTDGQDLWNGGQVYRFDGQTQANITTDVRATGISRVDDIVTDGQSVLFLQNIVSRNNQFIIVKYKDGTYFNLTNMGIRSAFASDEGISSIKGYNGTWFIVTTKNRLFRWSGDANQPTRVSIGGTTDYTLSTIGSVNYLPGGSTRAGSPISIFHTAGGWVLMTTTRVTSLVNYVEYFRYDGTYFTKLDSGPTATWIDFAASNNQELVFSVWNGTTCASQNVWSFNGVTFTQIQGITTNYTCDRYQDTNTLYGGMGLWDGSSWMVVTNSVGYGKKLYQIQNNAVTALGSTRDYFVTGASNGSGTIYLGGAVSDINNTQPSYPLTAKLVKAVVGGATQTNTTNNAANTTNQTAYGIHSWTWIDPSQNYIRRDQNLNFNVGAQSANGVKKIEIVINGATAKTCDLNSSTSNQTCSFSIWGGTYGLGTTVAVNAKVTDGKGASAWTALSYLTVTAANETGSNTNNNNTNNTVTNNFGLSAWQWLEPSGTTIKNSQSMTFYVGAQHANGLNRVELYVNGAVRRTCSLSTTSANQTCSVTINGSEYPAGTAIAMNAKVVGTAGEYQQLWTPLITLNVTTADGTVATSTTQNASAPTTWIWVIPPGTNLLTSPASYHVGAWDGENGIRRIEMWVNGTVKRVCSFSDVKTNVECSWDILLGDYPAGSEVFVNAKVEDAAGNIAWAQSQSWRVETNTATSQYIPNMALYLFNLYKK